MDARIASLISIEINEKRRRFRADLATKAVAEPAPVFVKTKPRSEIPLSAAFDAVQKFLDSKQPIMIKAIARLMSDLYEVRIGDVLGIYDSKIRSVNRPRQIAMFLAHVVADRPLRVVGGVFGGRDHTTVREAVLKIRREVNKSPELKAKLAELKALAAPRLVERCSG